MSSAFSTADSYMSVSSNESFCHVEFNGTQRSSPELYNGSVMDLAPQQHYLYQGMDNSMDYHQLTGISSGWNGFHGANSSGSSSFVTLSPASHASGPRSLVNGQSTAGGQSYGKATPSSCGGLTVLQKQHLFTPKIRVVKRRVSANKKERRRTISINTAFTDLRDCIPNVPVDTKLSKIKTLKLATSYISWLMEVLQKNDARAIPADGFQTILTKTLESREDRRKREILKAAVSEQKKQARRNRTGWPQHVWAQELDHDNNKK